LSAREKVPRSATTHGGSAAQHSGSAAKHIAAVPQRQCRKTYSSSAAAAVPQNIAAVPQRQCRKTCISNKLVWRQCRSISENMSVASAIFDFC